MIPSVNKAASFTMPWALDFARSFINPKPPISRKYSQASPVTGKKKKINFLFVTVQEENLKMLQFQSYVLWLMFFFCLQ